MPRAALISFPSIGGCSTRTNVPFCDAPVTIASNRSPMRDDTSIAAADFRICRSTLLAASSCLVQCSARCPSSGMEYGEPPAASAAFNSRCVMRSGKRRFGAVECV